MKSNNKRYQYELEILKIIGAIGIVLFHYTFRGYAADDLSSLYFPYLGEVSQYGYFGIYLFFILSGYTIILSAGNKKIWEFVLARMMRLYPGFWASVCLTTLVTLVLGGEKYQVGIVQFLVNLTMLSGFVGVESVDGTYWFMFVILRYYFLVALLVLFGQVKRQEYFSGVWLVAIALVEYFSIPKIGFFLIPQYAPFLISGMAICSIRKSGINCYRLILLSLSVLFSLYFVFEKICWFNGHYGANINNGTATLFMLILYVVVLVAAFDRFSFSFSKIITILGSSTYPLYLIHHNIGFMLFDKLEFIGNKYIILMSTIVIVIAASIFISRYIERYIYQILNYIVNKDIYFKFLKKIGYHYYDR